MRALTYDDWRAAGYQVKPGEKSTGRNTEGTATFTRDQVYAKDSSPEENDGRH